tara:strand:- start:330 stop:1121 length:792 start_codon:yes stop_codon:yes gene_type:complete
LKINFKIKSFCFLFSFLSLFTYEIVNSEEIKDFPYKKGSYLVCANGKVLPPSIFGSVGGNPFDPLNPYGRDGYWEGGGNSIITFAENTEYYRPWKDGKRVELKYDFWITAEVIIGKEPKLYRKDEKEAIMKRFLKGASIPTSYKSTFIGFVPSEFKDYPYPRRWIYKFKNSENKEITIRRGYESWTTLMDNKGNYFRADIPLFLAMLYCKNDYMVLRAVDEIDLREGQVTNEYNENMELPTIFMRTEIGVKGKSPNMQKNYDF